MVLKENNRGDHPSCRFKEQNHVGVNLMIAVDCDPMNLMRAMLENQQ
jgi:hypothetical protein